MEENNTTPSQEDTPVHASVVYASQAVVLTTSTASLVLYQGSITNDSPGVLKFDGPKAVMIPAGSNSTRPETGKIGMVRINNEEVPYLEMFNGIDWQNVSKSSSAAGETSEVQFNSNGALSGSNKFKFSTNESESKTTLTLGNPAAFNSPSNSAHIVGESSGSSKQGTTVYVSGGNNSDTGNAGSVCISGGYAIGSGTQAGNVIISGGESSVGNHGSVILTTVSNDGGPSERFRVAGGTGAWGLEGENYGSAGQVLTSRGYSASPVWTTITGVAKVSFGFNSNQNLNLVVIPTNAVVLSISIVITQAFDNPDTKILVGDAAVPDRLMSSDDSLPTVPGSYTVYPNYVYGIGTQMTLTIQGANTAGMGVVTVTYQ